MKLLYYILGYLDKSAEDLNWDKANSFLQQYQKPTTAAKKDIVGIDTDTKPVNTTISKLFKSDYNPIYNNIYGYGTVDSIIKSNNNLPKINPNSTIPNYFQNADGRPILTNYAGKIQESIKKVENILKQTRNKSEIDSYKKRLQYLTQKYNTLINEEIPATSIEDNNIQYSRFEPITKQVFAIKKYPAVTLHELVHRQQDLQNIPYNVTDNEIMATASDPERIKHLSPAYYELAKKFAPKVKTSSTMSIDEYDEAARDYVSRFNGTSYDNDKDKSELATRYLDFIRWMNTYNK